MRCDEIMSTESVTTRDSDTVAQATDLLIAHRLLSMPVVDAQGRYLGMFGTVDLAALIVPRVALAGSVATNIRFIGNDIGQLTERFRELKGRRVSEVADNNAISLPPETPAIEAFRIFCRDRAPLAIVDGASRKLLGVVSYWAVLSAVSAAP